MKQRIQGIDLARAFAIIGMIIVNFKIVFGIQGSETLNTIAGFFDGKAAATFVTLAGIGVALMVKSALNENDNTKLRRVRKTILKRSLLLFVLGLSYMEIWPADILHYYGVYMAILALLLTFSKKLIFRLGWLIVFTFPLLLFIFDYELGWNFKSLEYKTFWTIKGFIRNLIFNGFHPVLPWISFLFIGYWFGSFDLQNRQFIRRIAIKSFIGFIAIQFLSRFFIALLSQSNPESIKTFTEFFGTQPMPPLPFYMINGICFSLFAISSCLLIDLKYQSSSILTAFKNMGKMALTFYVAHIIIGMGIIDVLFPNTLGTYSIHFSVLYALTFSIFCILFAYLWLKKYKSGPLEWLFRKLTQ